MAITLVGTIQTASDTGTAATYTLSLPGGVQQNDVVYVIGTSSNGSITSGPGGSESGWTNLYTDSGKRLTVDRKVLPASPQTSVTVNGGGAFGPATAYLAIVLRGAFYTSPEDATTTTATGTDLLSPNNPSITTAHANSWILAVAGSSTADATPGTISGYSNTASANATSSFLGACTVAGATFEKTAAGAEDPAQWSSWTTNINGWAAATIAVRAGVSETVGSASGTGTANGVSAKVFSGQGSASGTGSANAVGASPTQFGTASGIGAANGVGRAFVAATGSAVGTGTAHASSTANEIVGTAQGVGTANGVGVSRLMFSFSWQGEAIMEFVSTTEWIAQIEAAQVEFSYAAEINLRSL